MTKARDTADINSGTNTAAGEDALENNTASNNTAVGYQAGYSNTTGGQNTLVGWKTGHSLTTGVSNTFVGCPGPGDNCGSLITSGSKNTILGAYTGNQNGLDIRTSSNNIVLSDGDGNPRGFFNPSGALKVPGNAGVGDLASTTSQAHEIVNELGGSDYTLKIRNTNGSDSGYPLEIQYTNSFDNNDSRFITCDDPNSIRFAVYSDGDTVNHDNSYGAYSDEKLKQQIVDASSQWDDLKALRVRKFKLNGDVEAYGDSDDLWRLGVIAQEVEAAGMNGLVKENPDAGPENPDATTSTKTVKYSILYMKAVKALQEAMTRIETLETKVTALEG